MPSSSLLNTIDHPKDIKSLSIGQLESLAKEIRQRIIEVMSVNGGHLASSLGAVELTLALHHVFDTPNDRLIWDIGHQTYSQKLITGRRDTFKTVRQFKGLSGFCQPDESPFDHFHTGHAGQALSLALGVAKARDLNQSSEYVVPIIGDAALSCGLTLEALNNMSRELKRFVVILNDNKMSISQNVGRISHILSRILSNPTCSKLHQELDALIHRIPSVGERLTEYGHRITSSVKNLVSPAVFFEHFGLSYIGPIDGHDIKKVIDTLQGVRDSAWPVLVHVVTRKGEGMAQAVNNPTPYHGARPFCIQTGKFHPSTSTKRTFPKIFGNHVLKMADQDPTLVAVTPAMSAGSCLDDFMTRYPDRCIDVGIAEGHCVTYAGGLAYGRRNKVIACLYSTFLQRAFDNVYHDVCLQELPVVFAIDRAGIAGGDGAMANGIYDIGFLNAMPNMIIAQPRDGKVLTELLDAVFSYNRPTAIRYPNIPAEEPTGPYIQRELGRAELLAKGEELLLIGLGHMAYTALEVKQLLQSEGINASVMDPIFVKPLDSEMLCDLLLTHQKIVTIEEHSLQSGLGAILNHFLLCNGYTNVQVANFGIPETFVQQGSHQELLNELKLTPSHIHQTILQKLYSNKETQVTSNGG